MQTKEKRAEPATRALCTCDQIKQNRKTGTKTSEAANRKKTQTAAKATAAKANMPAGTRKNLEGHHFAARPKHKFKKTRASCPCKRRRENPHRHHSATGTKTGPDRETETEASTVTATETQTSTE